MPHLPDPSCLSLTLENVELGAGALPAPASGHAVTASCNPTKKVEQEMSAGLETLL